MPTVTDHSGLRGTPKLEASSRQRYVGWVIKRTTWQPQFIGH